jgi:CBS domain-containing protein
MARRVREVMTAAVVMVSDDSSLVVAAREMREHGIGDVFVMEDGRLIGMVTDRDIVVRAIALSHPPDKTTVGEICSRKPVTIAPDADEDEALELMRRHAVRRLPVMEAGRLVGVVSLGDLAVDLERDSTLGGISAAPPGT